MSQYYTLGHDTNISPPSLVFLPNFLVVVVEGLVLFFVDENNNKIKLPSSCDSTNTMVYYKSTVHAAHTRRLR